MIAAEYKLIGHGAISVRPGQPRKHFDDAKLAELAESIKAVGIIEPLLVRPVVRTAMELAKMGRSPLATKAEATDYELVCGERRWRAAKLANLKEVPCLVRELTDLQALEIQGIENLQREDLSPLEEAGWMQQLLDSKAYTVQTLGEKIGKKRSAIFARLRLLKLSPALKKALEDGSIDATKAGLISAIPDAKTQEKRLKECIPDEYGYIEITSTRDLQESIEKEDCRDLRQAAFDKEETYTLKGLADEKAGGKGMVMVGPCKDCKYRSGNMPEAAELSNPNTCTRILCFNRKCEAHRAALAARHAAAGLKVLNEKQSEAALGWRAQDNYVKPGDTVPGSKKTWQQALGDKLPAAVVAISDKGAAVKLLVKEELLAEAKKLGVKLERPREDDKYQKLRDAEEEKCKRRRAIAVTAVEQVLAAARAGKTDTAFLRLLFTGRLDYDLVRDNGWTSEEAAHKAIAAMAEPDLRALALKEKLNYRVSYNGEWSEPLKLACAHYGVDLAALEKEPAKAPQKATKETKKATTANPKSEIRNPKSKKK